ncbi:hypothetical protein [Sediminicola luteus]|uniref:RiboL-PSP-HEPN domain-containing protein n=1 Tax=Sediminicola luteus TaxID=319238 RepID=A0ABV2TWY5_9FLAO
MIETIKYATISKIYVKNMIFYDNNKSDELIKLCRSYGITYLPGQDRKSCYRLVDNEFHLSKLTKDLICYPYDRLFNEATLRKFESGNHDEVMFVIEDDKIKGVVHVVDYNTDFINYEFFKATYQFENLLRQLLINNGENNESLLKWMSLKAEKNNHWKKRLEQCVPKEGSKLIEENLRRINCNPFQTFFLNDLLYFVASRKYVSKGFRQNLESITSIRNWVAHNKDLTHKPQIEHGPLYRIEELKEFVNNANTFFKCFEELEELILSEN